MAYRRTLQVTARRLANLRIEEGPRLVARVVTEHLPEPNLGGFKSGPTDVQRCLTGFRFNLKPGPIVHAPWERSLRGEHEPVRNAGRRQAPKRVWNEENRRRPLKSRMEP